MSYFANFPYTTFELDGQSYVVKDIMLRSVFISDYKPYTDLFTTHTILETETPESIALEYYKSPTLHWVILLFNEIHDLETEWPVSQYDIQTLCETKYGDDIMYTIRHYEKDGIIYGTVNEFGLPPKYVDLSLISTGISNAVNNIEPEKTLFTNTMISGRSLGDINNNGIVGTNDVRELNSYLEKQNTNTDQISYIENTLIPYIESHPTVYVDYFSLRVKDPGNGTAPVSFFEHEINLNEKKREIKILRPELLSQFLVQFKESLNG